jgi:hypothetical protein
VGILSTPACCLLYEKTNCVPSSKQAACPNTACYLNSDHNCSEFLAVFPQITRSSQKHYCLLSEKNKQAVPRNISGCPVPRSSSGCYLSACPTKPCCAPRSSSACYLSACPTQPCCVPRSSSGCPVPRSTLHSP